MQYVTSPYTPPETLHSNICRDPLTNQRDKRMHRHLRLLLLLLSLLMFMLVWANASSRIALTNPLTNALRD